MDEAYVRERITQLRINKGVSEYQMSHDLGHSRGYMNNISSGKSMPSMKEFFAICDYFKISPVNFFDEGIKYPAYIQKAIEGLKELDEEDTLLILNNIQRLKKKLSSGS